jgi:Caspase domain
MRMMLQFRFWAALLCLALATATRVAAAEKRVALVMGNSAYQHTQALRNPRNDAADISKELKRLGFRVISGVDLDKSGMDQKIRDFAEAIAGAEAGVFFYAGHGLQVSGQNYLVPIDAKLTTAQALDFEMVRLDLIQRVMERETKTNVIFLDACRNNPLSRNLARAMGTRSMEVGTGLAPVESGLGTLISFSTQPGNVALDGQGRNSPFAEALVKYLASPTEDLSSMLVSVRNDVMKTTENKQVPWEHSALRAKFYFQELRSMSTESALKACVKAELHPNRIAISQRLIETLRSKKFRYGWYGGVANAGDEQKETSHEIVKIETNGDQVDIDYDWQHGRLRLIAVAPFYGSREARGVTLQGTWTQDNGFGCVELMVDGNQWEGHWSQRVGADWAQRSFLKPE